MKKFISSLVAGLVVSVSIGAFACGVYSTQIKVLFNANDIKINGKISYHKGQDAILNTITYNNVTYVNLKSFCDKVGYSVIYDSVNKNIYVDKKGKELNGWKK